MAPSAVSFKLGQAITREDRVEPFDPAAADQELPSSFAPPVRRIAVFTQDPATPRMDISTAEIQLPFEPLAAGPSGPVMCVIDRDITSGRTFEPVDLDRLGPGYPAGLRPSVSEPKFAQQMTYAVAMRTYETFRTALGRTPQFAFGPHPEDTQGVRLHLYPHAMQEANAYYDPDLGALLFGYTFSGRQVTGLNQPGGIVFTALSHDVVVHETTHALLDGMRARFLIPSNPDVPAFHEGFADLVALFLRFGYRDLVGRAIDDAEGGLTSRLLTDFARQFGQAIGDGQAPLRAAILAGGQLDEPVPSEHQYECGKECHLLGAVLVAAVFDAFRWIFAQKTAGLRSLLRISPAVAASGEMKSQLVTAAQRLAKQFLNILIRAVDYCPPVDLTFGEYLRALITADHDLVPDDPWGYREAFVRAFRRYGITVPDVLSLSEDSLLWRPPEHPLPPISELAFPDLHHGWEPGTSEPVAESKRRAEILGQFICCKERLWYFGLAQPRGGAQEITEPVVESVRTLRRIGLSGQVSFDQVAEVVQRRRLVSGLWLEGGATLIIDSRGRVRYAVCKNVESRSRELALDSYRAAASEPELVALQGADSYKRNLLRKMHQT